MTLCYISGMVKMERARDRASPSGAGHRPERVRHGAAASGKRLYNLGVEKRATMDEAVFDMIGGNCIPLFQGKGGPLLYCRDRGEAVHFDPENEPAQSEGSLCGVRAYQHLPVAAAGTHPGSAD